MIKKSIALPNSEINIVMNTQYGSKGDILFIHGLGCSKESFNDAFTATGLSDYNLIAPDLPGFGVSSKEDNILYEMSNQAEYLKSLLDILKINNPIIIAHSMGGAIALLLIEQLKSIRHFFCLEGNLVAEDCSISRKVAALSQDYFVNKEYIDHPLKYRCQRLSSDPEASPVSYYKSSVSLLKLTESGKLLEKYLKLECPKTYIYGEENKNTRAVSLLEGEDLVEVDGCGHFMMT
ncbi:MAG: alpha/beta hydrolase, partial [Pseudomonadota bacterium]